MGELFALKNFGVNLVHLFPGGESAVLHRHTRQDEFVYVLEGELVLETDDGECTLAAGQCVGFAAGGAAHRLVNRTPRDAVYLEIGDRTPGDEASYPKDDLAAQLGPDGKWRFVHKDGTP
ncbi:MAG: cupin domain-containing protein, partial [Nevskia sp.]|nr:cupin domain-containing protein [Nevskia sp.]